MQMILGTDIFDTHGELVRERRTELRGNVKVIDLEVGRSGVTYEIVTVDGGYAGQ